MGKECHELDRGEPDASSTIDVLKCLRCAHQGCTNVPSWGHEGRRPILCSEHASANMVQVVELRCQEPGCKSRRTYGFDSDAAQFCAVHKLEGMIDLMKRRTQCAMLNCTKLSTYGFEGFLARFCFSHKLQDMVYLKNRKRCEFYECTRQPTYGIDGKEAVFCLAHKEEGMTDVKNCRCKHPGCKRQPNYGHEGGRANYCSAHKLGQMINVVSRRCAFLGCKRQPIYGFEGAKAIFCPHHRLDTMVDVVNRQCEFNGCSKTPSYGYPGGRAQYCAHHHLEDMEDVKNRRCEWNECRRYPFFGKEGERSRFCSAHKEEGMVNIRSRRCEDDSCSKSPTHGFPGEKARACPGHIKPGMVQLKGLKSFAGLTDFRKYENAMNSLMGTGSGDAASVGTHLNPDEMSGALGMLGGMQSRPAGGLGSELHDEWHVGSREPEVVDFMRNGGYRPHAYAGQEAPEPNATIGWGDSRGGTHGSRVDGGRPDTLLSSDSYHGRDHEVPFHPKRQTMSWRNFDLKGEVVEDGLNGRLREAYESKDPGMRASRSQFVDEHIQPQILRAKDEQEYRIYKNEYQGTGPPFSNSKQQVAVVQHPQSSTQRMAARPPAFGVSYQDVGPELYGHRDEEDHRHRQQHDYQEPRAKDNFNNNSSSHFKLAQGYDPGLCDSGEAGAPTSGEVASRSALRPLQQRSTMTQSHVRRSPPPSLNRSDNSIPDSVSDAIADGAKKGGGVSPFVMHQASPHFRLSSMPPMLSGPFTPSYHLLDRDNSLRRDACGLAGATGAGAGDVAGDGREYVAAEQGGREGHWGRDYEVSMGHVDHTYPARDSMRSNGGGAKANGVGGEATRGATTANSTSPPMVGTGFGSRISDVDLGSGLIPPINRMPEVRDGRNSSSGSFHNTSQETSVSSVTGERSSISSLRSYMNDSTAAVVVPPRPLSPPMTVLGDPGESPSGLPRLSAVDHRAHGFNANTSESSQRLPGSSSAPLMSAQLLERGQNVLSITAAPGSYRGPLAFASVAEQGRERFSRAVESEDIPAEAPEAPSDPDDYNGAVVRGQKVSSLSGGIVGEDGTSQHDAMGPSASGGGQEADADNRKRFRIEELLH